ncbi:MAG: flagellar biosynthesis protein FlhB [Syntrophales bacterium]|nr:flagellar biosynthesis protein FlhB [Syntrophales bacterium]MDY0043117.1 flagellar biosynthesis protein FlhB [Syntrophales bacterium]
MTEEKSGQEKTEKPSQKRRDDARKKGQVAKSQEITSAAILMASILVFYCASFQIVKNLCSIMRWNLTRPFNTACTCESISEIIGFLARETFVCLSPVLCTLFAVALFTNVLQTGFIFAPESVKPQFSKLNPVNGFKRLFSIRSLLELIKNIFKIIIVALIAYSTIKGELENLIIIGEQSPGEILSLVGSIALTITFRSCLVLIVLAILDYAFQRWEHEKKLRMSKQEVKDELKHTEGDPLIKARIRRLQREAARKRMIADVAKADVVITNPTHIAVALKYDRKKMVAPKVTAKGQGFMAEKIKETARENKIPIVENKILAQVLNKTVAVNETIPEELYNAVAEVLAYVFKLGGRRSSEWSNL